MRSFGAGGPGEAVEKLVRHRANEQSDHDVAEPRFPPAMLRRRDLARDDSGDVAPGWQCMKSFPRPKRASATL